MPLLEIKNLELSFEGEIKQNKFYALKGINFAINESEILALVGESGSGKTLTALSVLGLQPVTAKLSGEIIFKNINLLQASNNELRAIRGRYISLIPQDPLSALNPVYTIGSQLVEAVLAHNKNLNEEFKHHQVKKAVKSRSIDYLAKVGIPDPSRCFESYPHELSGGMRQRVMIAMAIINEPDLLIADEPTTALDVTVQAVILELLKSLKKTILFITHDLSVVAEIADRVIVMKEGQIVEQADIYQLFAKPQSDYTKHLLESIPKL